MNAKRGDEIFRLLKGRITLRHFVLILFFVLLTVFSGVYGLLWWDTPQGTVALSFAVALAVATIVDLAYNYVVMKDVEEMVAKHLMLNKDVQSEIVKKDKIGEILTIALENTVGQKLAIPFKDRLCPNFAEKYI